MNPNLAIHLRPVRHTDLPYMYMLQADPASNDVAATIARTREAFDKHWAAALDDLAVSARVILLGNETVGYISAFPKDGEHHVGYWIDRGYWGRGIASRALDLLLQEVARRPLVAIAATSNKASLRVLEKCGFTVEKVHVAPACERHPECEVAVLVLR